MEKKDRYIENIGCSLCGNKDSMGVYQREDKSYHGTCFSITCKGHTNEPYEGGEPTKKTIEAFQDEAKNYEVAFRNIEALGFNDLPSRGISGEVCELYNVRSRVDLDGDDVVHYYQQKNDSEITGYMERRVQEKKFRNVGYVKQPEFFGQDICGMGGKMIVVTEGQLDCLAAKMMFKEEGKNYRVVSIPNGAGSAVSCFKENYEWVSSFSSIILAFDMDDPGRLSAEQVGALFEPNRVKTMFMSEKDPNEMLRQGKSREFLTDLFNAKESFPDGIVSVDDLYEEAIKPPEIGLSFPFPSLNSSTYGYRRSELYGVGAGSGCGKTECFKEFIDHTIFHHKLPAGIIFLEEPAAKTLKVLAGKHCNKRFHIPEGDWSVDELIEAINQMKGMAYFYNHSGAKDWESIKAKIKYMVIALGIKDIYLDHLTALVAQEENEYKALNRIMEELASLTQELDCTIFYISHLRKATGTPHEEGGQVSADQFKGSGAIVFWTNFIFGLERNQQAPDFEERNTTTFRVLKDRNTGLATGLTFKLLYNHDTGRWVEIDETDFDDEDDE